MSTAEELATIEELPRFESPAEYEWTEGDCVGQPTPAEPTGQPVPKQRSQPVTAKLPARAKIRLALVLLAVLLIVGLFVFGHTDSTIVWSHTHPHPLWR
jgi:hypothetical protein